jgi:simple sugar transport system ATP-binding protein
MADAHLLELDDVSKYYGNIIALRGVSTFVNAGEVTCVLGDNGAGKSTLIKILSGVHQHDSGHDPYGQAVTVRLATRRPRRGIATVYQDLAMVPLMSVWRNFWLGAEPTKGWGPFRRIDIAEAKEIAKERAVACSASTSATRAAGRHPVGRRAPVGRDRPCRSTSAPRS